MYTLSIQRSFVAQHYLIGGDWGPENQQHSHYYRMEVTLEGHRLDQHGYLVDIVHLEALLDALVARYRDHTLNDLPEFQGLNPSIEHFCRIIAQRVDQDLQAPNICAITVRIWENAIASASYRQQRTCD